MVSNASKVLRWARGAACLLLPLLALTSWQTPADAAGEPDKSRTSHIAPAPAAKITAEPPAPVELVESESVDSPVAATPAPGAPFANPLDSRNSGGIRLIRYGHVRRIYGVH